MTDSRAEEASSTQWTESSAREWLAGQSTSRQQEMRDAWRIAVTIVGGSGDVRRMLDAGSGPGSFLSAMLEEFPHSRGVWLDAFDTMRTEAKQNLAPFGDRVDYVTADLVRIADVAAAGEFDAVTTSRVTHHLTDEDLAAFYAGAARVLRPGGWIANVDNVRPSAAWEQRMRSARERLRPARGPRSESHPHVHPPATWETHVRCLREAGFTEIQEVWRSFMSVLLMARLPDDSTT